ncbi:MAG: homocysteine S-methyltransferase [Ancrocorticia sp.]|nr:homocysteine S-methyltransferase [Ancrocorticia sp.]MCI2179068.1 homocysteine S-methyltransferase [Ancrocorticia sp.]MCI2192705.1 homocysteine S-methyltransferase [Ancrocorticia sp.]
MRRKEVWPGAGAAGEAVGSSDLAARGNDVTGALWSAEILRRHPEEVRAAHRDFFEAGAMVATTCSYLVTFDGLRAAGGTDAETELLLRTSVQLARGAAPEGGLVFASVGPYGAGPGAGTEYDGAYGLTTAELARWHRPRLEILADSGADVLLAETIPSMREVDALITELDRIGAAAILSVTATGNRLPDGTDIREVATRVAGSPAIVSIGVNCCSGDTALAAIRALRSVTTLPLIAYPNSGESWDRVARQWHAADSVTNPVAAAPKLLQAGAQLIGGCCRVSPSDIQQIAALLRPAAKPLS